MIESKRFWFKRNAIDYVKKIEADGKSSSIWSKYFLKPWIVEVYEKWDCDGRWDKYEFGIDKEDESISYMDGQHEFLVDENAVIGQKDVDDFVSKANAEPVEMTGSTKKVLDNILDDLALKQSKRMEDPEWKEE